MTEPVAVSEIVRLLPRSAIIMAGSAEQRAQRADLLLRIGVEIGRMPDEDVWSCARRGTAKPLRDVARAEIERRRGLS